MNKFEHFIDQMQTNWPKAFQSLHLLFPQLGKISNYVDEEIARLMKEKNLLPSDFHLLTAIRRSCPKRPFEVKPSELCNYMLFSWGGLNKSMNRLENKGIITRINSSQDKRIRMIRLSLLGEEVIEHAALELHKFHQKLLSDFTDKEIELLSLLLEKLLHKGEEIEQN